MFGEPPSLLVFWPLVRFSKSKPTEELRTILLKMQLMYIKRISLITYMGRFSRQTAKNAQVSER